MEKIIKKSVIVSWIILLATLIVATVYEKLYGTESTHISFYGNWWFVVLWSITALLSVCYIFRQRLIKRPIVFSLHCSFVIILLGALLTYYTASRGSIHIAKNESKTTYVAQDNSEQNLPIVVTLNDFDIIYYPGTSSPADYQANISINDIRGKLLEQGSVSMNNILSCHSYRFYQSGYDEDLQGCTFLLVHDPWGIGVTYLGYFLLILSILLFAIFDRKYLLLLKNAFGTKVTIIAALLCTGTANAQNVLPKDVAAKFGDLYVYHNGRISPLQTLAKDFTTKLYGSQNYHNFTPEQVFTGWMFYYSHWKQEPMIKIKGDEAQSILGIESKYASLIDFRGKHNEYKLDSMMTQIARGSYSGDINSIVAADEKFNLITSFYSGELMKIYPYCADGDRTKMEWFSQGSNLPRDIDDKQWFFIKKSWDYIFELVISQNYQELSFALDKIKKYQQNTALDNLPSDTRFRAEKIYNQYVDVRFIAFPALAIGLLGFLFFCFNAAVEREFNRISLMAAILATIILSFFIGLRGIILGHIPMSNGIETMQFMALCTLILSLSLCRRYNAILPFGLLICGLSLLVSAIGSKDAQMTLLMPVLNSPLLSLHVAIIMIAYALLAMIMMNGVAAIIIKYFRKENQVLILNMYSISRILVIPAVFCLAIGIFIGAIWANISWGTYWSWDPKETWALITMLIYSSALHAESLPIFKRPMAFHIFTVAAFITVLITYFGVNYLLGGMHSYS